MTSSGVNIERELSRLSAGTMRTGEMLEVSRRLMATAKGAQWSHAAGHHARALYARGRLAEAFAMLEDAWQRADRLDDPVAAGRTARIGAICNFLLYDYLQAEQWCRRELERRRSRLIGDLRYMLADLLAMARVAQGDLAEAREVLSEWEGAESRHWLLAYHEGDWERSLLLLRKEFDRVRAAGQLFDVAAFGAALGRSARIGNQRVEAEAILDESLQASLTSPDLPVELYIRIELAIINSDLGQFPQARAELQRCKEILDNGEDWRGHRGAFSHTVALVKAAEHVLKFVSSDGRWHIALHQRSVLLPEEVVEGFRTAIEIFRRYRAPWEETAALLYWSQTLFAASQIRESFEKFEAAFAIFDQIATPQWNARLQTDLFRFITLDSLAEPITIGDGAGANVFRKEGDYWTVSFRGSMFRLRDTIGMHYISRLLANPGIVFAVKELVDNAHQANGKRGAFRNSRAARPNATRTDRVDPDDHEERKDADRERARLMVTKRIKDVIIRIRRSNPGLARHLATRIRTGYVCSYVKDAEHPDGWLT